MDLNHKNSNISLFLWFFACALLINSKELSSSWETQNRKSWPKIDRNYNIIQLIYNAGRNAQAAIHRLFKQTYTNIHKKKQNLFDARKKMLMNFNISTNWKCFKRNMFRFFTYATHVTRHAVCKCDVMRCVYQAQIDFQKPNSFISFQRASLI